MLPGMFLFCEKRDTCSVVTGSIDKTKSIDRPASFTVVVVVVLILTVLLGRNQINSGERRRAFYWNTRVSFITEHLQFYKLLQMLFERSRLSPLSYCPPLLPRVSCATVILWTTSGFCGHLRFTCCLSYNIRDQRT